MELKFQVQTKIQKPVEEVFDAVHNPDKLSGYFTNGGPVHRFTRARPSNGHSQTIRAMNLYVFPSRFSSSFPTKRSSSSGREQRTIRTGSK